MLKTRYSSCRPRASTTISVAFWQVLAQTAVQRESRERHELVASCRNRTVCTWGAQFWLRASHKGRHRKAGLGTKASSRHGLLNDSYRQIRSARGGCPVIPPTAQIWWNGVGQVSGRRWRLSRQGWHIGRSSPKHARLRRGKDQAGITSSLPALTRSSAMRLRKLATASFCANRRRVIAS